MQRIKEEFLDKLEEVVCLSDKKILEIGCGNGSRSVDIAARCGSLVAIEPDKEIISIAQRMNIPNAVFIVGSADTLEFNDQEFDSALFTLSFHHISVDAMSATINEVLRVIKKSGFLVFLEPTHDGSFFDAEIMFDACDGDEREEKASAYHAMMVHSGIVLVREIDDETIFRFDSVDDFIFSMSPKKNIVDIREFLEKHAYTLRAGRRISIFQAVR